MKKISTLLVGLMVLIGCGDGVGDLITCETGNFSASGITRTHQDPPPPYPPRPNPWQCTGPISGTFTFDPRIGDPDGPIGDSDLLGAFSYKAEGCDAFTLSAGSGKVDIMHIKGSYFQGEASFYMKRPGEPSIEYIECIVP